MLPAVVVAIAYEKGERSEERNGHADAKRGGVRVEERGNAVKTSRNAAVSSSSQATHNVKVEIVSKLL